MRSVNKLPCPLNRARSDSTLRRWLPNRRTLLAGRKALPAVPTLLALCAGLALPAQAAPAVAVAPAPAPAAATPVLALDDSLRADINQLVKQATLPYMALPGLTSAPRLELQVGELDSRLQLAPCAKVQAYWPSGQRLLGNARIGLRCVQGAKPWNVYLPLAIRIWGQGLVSAEALPAGTLLRENHLRAAEVDLAARPDPALLQAQALIGRPLARPMVAGQALRRDDVKLRQWVRVGDMVKLVASGGGFEITGEAKAMANAAENQPVQVRTENGRTLQGLATGERQVTVAL